MALSSPLPAWAIDDNGVDDDNGFFDNLSIGLGNFGKNLLGAAPMPVQIQTPGIPSPGDCDEAKAAALAAKNAQSQMFDNLLTWEREYRGTSEAFGATSGIGLIQAFQTAADAMAQFSWVGQSQAAGSIANLSSAEQVAVLGSDGVTIGAHMSSFVTDLYANFYGTDFHDPTAVSKFVAATAADFTANAIDRDTLKALGKEIIANPASPYAIVADSINLILTVMQGVDDYQAALAGDQLAEYQYNLAVNRYLQAVHNVTAANANCPPPKPPKPPTPPNPNPGPNQNVNNLRSADPNAKFATGVGAQEWVGPNQSITYTVEFENQPTASAAAQTVSITDPLSQNLDWSTLQLTAISFNNVVIAILPGAQSFSTNVHVSTDPNPVSVTASLNPSTGVITWFMESINPATGQLVTDPTAGFLPPDKANHVGEGYVVYSVAPKSGLATGTQITNQANIVFDVNAPILTPKTTNTIDVTAPTSTVNALAVDSPPTFTVSWTGSDTGAGIASYNILVSTNGGPWGAWLLGTTNKSAVFNGVLSNSYAFYSTTVDKVGNAQPAPGKAQAQTYVYVAGLPIIVGEPSNQVASLGGTASFTVSAVGKAPLTYAWYRNGTKVANGKGVTGATAATLKINPVAAANGGSYQVLVGNKLGSALSSNAVLVIGPGVAITSPKAGAITTNASMTVTGTASDASGPGLSQVFWQLNGSSLQPANGTTNWSASVALRAGTNVFAVQSVDANGLKSALVTRIFVYEVFQTITLQTNGSGTITITPKSKTYLIGANYKATATGTHGAKFVSWSGSTNSTANPLVFAMQSNMVLVANFATNHPAVVPGVYSGLFYPSNGVTAETSGFITVTVSGSDQRAYTGKLLRNGASHSFSGTVDETGAASARITREGSTPLDVNLRFAADSGNAPLSGSVSDAEGSGWSSMVLAQRADFNQRTNPATNYAGTFTLALTPETIVGRENAGGQVTVSNSLAGISTLGGKLADGTPVVWAAPIAADGSVPVYQSFGDGKGCLLGWIVFTDEPAQGTTVNVKWIKPTDAGGANSPGQRYETTSPISRSLESLR